MKTYQKWLDAAYIEFAHSGPDFSLKALAEKTNMPRATLYYHFRDKQHLIEELLEYHLKVSYAFHADLKQKVKRLIPDLYELLYQYRVNVMFHQQLLRNNHLEACASLYRNINNKSIIILLPNIRDYFKTNMSDHEVMEFYNTLTDAWYARLNFKKVSADSMCQLALEIMAHTLGVCKEPEEIFISKN